MVHKQTLTITHTHTGREGQLLPTDCWIHEKQTKSKSHTLTAWIASESQTVLEFLWTFLCGDKLKNHRRKCLFWIRQWKRIEKFIFIFCLFLFSRFPHSFTPEFFTPPSHCIYLLLNLLPGSGTRDVIVPLIPVYTAFIMTTQFNRKHVSEK